MATAIRAIRCNLQTLNTKSLLKAYNFAIKYLKNNLKYLYVNNSTPENVSSNGYSCYGY